MAKKTNSNITKARAAYKQAVKTSKPGEGKRFAALAKVAEASGAKNPETVAAKAMWSKYGEKGGAKLIAKGKKRKKGGK